MCMTLDQWAECGRVAECVYRVLHDNIAPTIEMRILADNIH